MKTPIILTLCAVLSGAGSARANEFAYLVGRAVEDITGPVWGVQMLGFVRADQIAEGLHTRQFARAIVIGEASGQNRIAYVVSDIAMVTHSLKLEVLDRLTKKGLGDLYKDENVILAGTHTHGAPGGFHHHLALSPIGGPFYQEYFDVLAEGMAEAVVRAHANLRPGNLLIARQEIDGASAQRSALAYENNPPEERMKYAANVDKTMLQLTLVDANGPIAAINWFAVHPTSMTFFNRLTTGDNKGYAAWRLENDMGTTYRDDNDFVAVFAQTNCGDVTPNLNLNNTGPGKDEVESTRIIGDRQVAAAKELLGKGERVTGPIDIRFRYVDFSNLEVDGEFTGRGTQRTCPSAFGYSFAAGSTEDGGGHPLFREGMTEPNPLIEAVLGRISPGPPPTDELRACQRPKVILFAPGLARPPMQEQVLPLGLVRIGKVVFVVGPGEFTTMTGRRFRDAVSRELDTAARDVVIAGYSNDFGGYVTTFEEYQTQQYEGGHTIFGPWEEAAFRQEYVRLARAMAKGETISNQARAADMRSIVKSSFLAGPDESDPKGAKFGDVVMEVSGPLTPGDVAVAAFWTGNPNNDYGRGDRYMSVQKQSGDGWKTVAEDKDWSTTIRYQQMVAEEKPKDAKTAQLEAYALGGKPKPARPEPFQATIQWRIPEDVEPGTYRLVHFGRYKKDGKTVPFEAASKPFEVK